MDDKVLRDLGVEQVEELDEDLFGPALGDQAQDLAGVNEEGGGQAEGAVADVFELPLEHVARFTRWQIGTDSLQGLDRGHLIHAYHHPALGGDW
jgi:hypothetical protein